jgi:flagellar basal body P-ring formation protein FlgA
MKSFALAAMIAAATLAAPAAAEAATLRPHATVDDSLVRLGDLFDDIGIGADIAIAHAPSPGRRVTFNVATLAEIARAYRIDWRPQSRFDRVVVERAGRIIQKHEVVAKLGEALQADGMRRNSEIEIAGRTLEIAVPVDAPHSIEIRNLSFDRQSGRFTAVVLAGGADASAQRLAVSGKVHDTTTVPVLRRTVSPGEVIRKDDVEMVRIREDRAGPDIIADPQRLIGTTPRFRLRAHEPVRESDTRPPIVVARNSTVTIMLQTGALTLTAQGRASEDGAKGDTIRVVNLQSKKTIEAVVSGPDRVTIYPGNHLAVN